jgi:hypothetical protein
MSDQEGTEKVKMYIIAGGEIYTGVETVGRKASR